MSADVKFLVLLFYSFKNPQNKFEEDLPFVKENLRWLEDQWENILRRMAAQRNGDDFTKKNI